MKIRRFFAKDMRTALAEVSRELGPDAAIMSSRRVSGGVELMAAIDYDPAVLSESRQSESAFVNEKRATPVSAQRESQAQLANLSDDSVQALIAMLNKSTEQTAASARAAQGVRSGTENLVASSPLLKNLFGAGKPKAEPAPTKAAPAKISDLGKRQDVARPNEANANTSRNSAAVSAQLAEKGAPADDDNFARRNDSAQAVQKFQLEFGNDPGLAGLRDEMRQMRGLMEEQLHGLAWKDVQQRTPIRALVARRLSVFDLSPRLREHYASTAYAPGQAIDGEQALAQAIANMARDVVASKDDLFACGGMYALVGPTGVGKTTTIAKIAARFALQHGAQNVALVSTDSYRIAAHDQLRVYARLIGCPLRIVDEPGQLAATLDGLVDKRLVLIDSAGMSQNDERLASALNALHSKTYPLKRLLVLSATAQRGLLNECVRQFGAQPLAGVILTKLDEATSLGALLSVLIESRLPLYFGCDGQRVPEDLRPMRGVQVVEKARRLAEQFQDGVDDWLLAQQWKGTADARA